MTTSIILAATVSPLRQRLIADMTMRRVSAETLRNYLRHVGRLASFLGRSPDTASAEDLRRFQIAQQETGFGEPTMKRHRLGAALLLRPHDRPARSGLEARATALSPQPAQCSQSGRGPPAARRHRLPSAPGGAVGRLRGLRAAEVASLKVGDVASTRMLLRVDRGKSRRDWI
ncbi:phage integrase N-terminal SAM-like domain-containing protein [Aureimonas sp. AU12]|uniref:phage integrase N-terminal SAM-like domain-containing protein n=1 Tax=Aureimonas sp. AU12 TaxID=1638161 RepID=UPI000B28BB3A|nr:phage integrase N-terminal SAM-like domain-containing protein [Aureimonas sp. AU12]